MNNTYELLELSASPAELGAVMADMDRDQFFGLGEALEISGALAAPTETARQNVVQLTKQLAKYGLQRQPKSLRTYVSLPSGTTTTSATLFEEKPAGATIFSTNIRGSNGLPSPERLFVDGICACWKPDVPALTNPLDELKALRYCAGSFVVGDKEMLDIPDLTWCPWGNPIAATFDNSAAPTEHSWQVAMGGGLRLAQPIVLRPTVNFRLNLVWEPGINPSADGRVYVALTGPSWRAIQ